MMFVGVLCGAVLRPLPSTSSLADEEQREILGSRIDEEEEDIDETHSKLSNSEIFVISIYNQTF